MTRWLSRITLFLLIALSLLLSFAACAEDETVYWINPDGGRYYHLDQNCPSIHPRYLPLSVYLTKEELAEQPYGNLYSPCNVCVNNENAVPEELRETGAPTEKPAWKMIVGPKYSEYALTDRYIREAPVFLDEHTMLAKADRDPEGYSTESRYLQWYQDGKLFREIECRHRDPSRWLYEGIFLSLPDGNVGLAAMEANALNFYRWEEEGLTLVQGIPGKWIELYGNSKAVCAIKMDESGATAHLYDPAGQEIWTYEFNDPAKTAGWQARPTATDEEGTCLSIVRAEADLFTALFIQDGKTAARQNLMYGAGGFYAGDQTYILAETTADDDLYADIILDHRDADGKCLGTKRLSGDRVVKSVHAILKNPETGGYTLYGRAVANSRSVYTVFRIELDSQMNQQSISVRSFDFHQDYNFSVVVKPNGEAFVYSRTFDESYVQPVLVPFEALTETESHGLRLH